MADKLSIYAPECPTTEALRIGNPLSDYAELEIALARERVGGILAGRENGLVAILGPCAMNSQAAIIQEEGETLRQLTEDTKGLYMAHRLPVWKPRSNPADWHGLETSDPAAAYNTLARQANYGAGVSIEMAHQPHAERYGDLTVVSWFGGRNIDNGSMMDAVALHDPDLPLAVKNGLDGSIDAAIGHVSRLTELRGPDAAPVVLLYRGGKNAQDPDTWEHEYRHALEVTGGNMIVDVAHGSEMAHHPDRSFEKSVAGQVEAMEHVITIAAKGELPAGIMAEASEAVSPTDPHMPFALAVSGVLRLHNLRYAESLRT